MTFVLGHGPIPHHHAPPLLGWQFCPFLGWTSTDTRLPSDWILGRALPYPQFEHRAKLTHTILIIFIITSNYKGYIVKYIVCGPILPYVQNVGKEGPGPISSLRANEYLRTSIRGMDKIAIQGEVEHVGEELGRVRGRRPPRDFCPRYLVNLLITQNNAWDKSYKRAKGEISNKK